jgi:hypothetical protein
MTQAIFFPKGHNNFFFLVFGSVILDNSVELSVNQEYENLEDAFQCYNDIKNLYPENSDIGIQKQIIEQVNIPPS